MTAAVLEALEQESPSGGLELNKAEKAIALGQLMLHWKDKLEEALAHAFNPFTFDQLVEGVMAGRFICFPYEDAFFLAEVNTFGTFKSFHVFIAVGNMEAITSAEPDFERVGRENECFMLTANGRKGWPRIAEKYGWKHISSVIAKEL